MHQKVPNSTHLTIASWVQVTQKLTMAGFSLRMATVFLFSDMPNPTVRPGYSTVMPYMVEKYGEKYAEWAMHRLRNLTCTLAYFFMDQISSQLRIVRPVAWNKTEVISQCIGVKGESTEARRNRIRQFEDFFLTYQALVHQTI